MLRAPVSEIINTISIFLRNSVLRVLRVRLCRSDWVFVRNAVAVQKELKCDQRRTDIPLHTIYANVYNSRVLVSENDGPNLWAKDHWSRAV